jgi:hypothetical protein
MNRFLFFLSIYSPLDGITYPTSTKQALAQSTSVSNLGGQSRDPANPADMLLLNEKNYSNVSNIARDNLNVDVNISLE